VLGIILVGALALRVNEISQQSLWIDELLSLEISNGRGFLEAGLPRGQLMDPAPDPTDLTNAASVWRIVPEQKCESHPPLYFLILRVWREMFPGDAAARMLTVLISVVAVFLFYDVGRLLGGTSAGLWAAAIAAVAGVQIDTAQEIRHYPMLLCMTLATVSALLRIERDGFSRKRGVILAVSLLGLMWTHYFGIAPAFALAIYAILRFRGKERKATLAIFAISGVIFLVLWGPILWQQHYSVEAALVRVHEAEHGHLKNTFDRLSMIPIRLLGEPLRNSHSSGAIAGIALLIFPLELRRRGKLLLPILLMVLPIALVLGMDLWQSSWELQRLRYVITCTAGFYVLLALPIIDRKWLRHLLPASAVLYGLISLPATYTPWKEDFRGVAGYIEQRGQPGDPVICYSNTGDDFEGSMYLGLRHYLAASHPMVIMNQCADERLISQLRSRGNIWIIMGWRWGTPIEREILPGVKILDARREEKLGMLYRVGY